jgi:hypothetical protein
MFSVQDLEEGVQVFLPGRIVLPGARYPAKVHDKCEDADGNESGHRISSIKPVPGNVDLIHSCLR